MGVDYGKYEEYKGKLGKKVEPKIITAFRNPIIPSGRIPADRIAEIGKLEYREYLKTPEWRAIRKYMREVSCQCAMCGCDNEKLQIHHNNYPIRGTETPNDLVALCPQCHKKFHFGGGKLLSDEADKMLTAIAMNNETERTCSGSFYITSVALNIVALEVSARSKMLPDSR